MRCGRAHAGGPATSRLVRCAHLSRWSGTKDTLSYGYRGTCNIAGACSTARSCSITGAYQGKKTPDSFLSSDSTVADQVLTESQTQFLKGNPDAGSPAYIRYSVWRPAPRCASVPRWRCLHMAPLPDRRRACVRGGRCLRLSSAAAGWRARSASPCRRPLANGEGTARWPTRAGGRPSVWAARSRAR